MNSILDEQVQRIVFPNGLEFHFVERGTGTPLIFLHGVLGDWRSWAPQWPVFSSSFRTISYSRRYNWPNQNSHPQADHSALIEAEDLSQLLDIWQTGPAILVGASYGAFTALALAVRYPHKVSGLVLIEPPMLRWADLSDAGRLARETFEREVRLPALKAFQSGDTALGVHLLTGGIVGNQMMQQMSAAVMEQRLQNARSIEMLTLSADEFPWLTPEQVRAVLVPTLLLAGERTPAVHSTVFENLVAQMPQARALRVPDAGHAVARDNPEAFNRLTEAFLKQMNLPGLHA